jgi:GT2 family glycosyltransferase
VRQVDVSIVVVTYEHADEIDACLDAALAQEGVSSEVIVVDNASGDATVERVRARGDAVRLLARDVNPGFADGVNAGVAAAAGRDVLLLNPDCVMAPGCAAALAAHLRATPDCGVAAALLSDLDGAPQRFARRRLSLGGLAWDATRYGRAADARWRGDRGHARRRYLDVDLHAAPAPVRVDEAAAACVLVERARMPEPLLDERFPLLCNDSDLYAVLRARGLHCDVVPAARAGHGYGTSLLRLQKAANRAEVVAAVRRYTRKHWSRPRAWAADLVFLADAAVGALDHLLVHRGSNEVRWNVLGILGAFGLPRGTPPWLTPAELRPRRE